jgi:hypothetical protein
VSSWQRVLNLCFVTASFGCQNRKVDVIEEGVLGVLSIFN